MNSFKACLYALPLHLKIKIFQMSLNGHLKKWSYNHREDMRNSLLVIRGEIIMRDCMRYELSDNVRYYSRSLCNRHVHSDALVYIDDNLYEDIDIRELSINHYWYHRTCRCMMCDKVRIVGFNSLPPLVKKKYQSIDWPIWSEQWISRNSGLVGTVNKISK